MAEWVTGTITQVQHWTCLLYTSRRLHTILERLVEEISFEASDMSGQTVTIDAEYVRNHLDELVADEDLSRFIL